MKRKLSKYPKGGKTAGKKSLPKAVSKRKFPGDLDPSLPSDNTKSNVNLPSNYSNDRPSFKDNLESTLAAASLVTPFPINYGFGLAGSAIDLYDAYNAQTPRERNNQLTEAALGAIPYGRMVKGAKLGTDYYKAYKSLRGFNTLNKGVDVKDVVDPNMQYANGGTTGEDFAYDRWRRSLPENLQSESPSYNLRGYWESLGKPEKFEPFNYDLYGGEYDGPNGEFLYHGFSRIK